MTTKSAGLKTLDAHREEMNRIQENEAKVRKLNSVYFMDHCSGRIGK